MRKIWLFGWCWCVWLSADVSKASEGPSPAPLFQKDDRVALIGNTFFERARLFGDLEMALQLATGPEITGLSVRNLGWSGDSVYGDSRSYFGPPQEGRERLAKTLEELKPQVVLLYYGTGEAMSVGQRWTDEPSVADRLTDDTQSHREVFVEGYRALIAMIREAAGEGLREIVLIAPTPLENLGGALPDQTQNNRHLADYRDAIRDLAAAEKVRFVDLFATLGGDAFDGKKADPALTTNGIHHDAAGYQVIAGELVRGLGYSDTSLLAREDETASELKAAILEKDRLFFHRWRPANETYLFLFRKHEQGQNAQEIPQFDPLIQAQEERLQKARAQVLENARKN